MDSYIGKILDNRYEILERIGSGGMAVVYKAQSQRLNRLVAVKILKRDLAQDADFRRRFQAEAQMAAQLSSPNIVTIYDVSRSGDIDYIVMELIDGITLKQYMERRGQLNWRESLHFITQIMRGLSHAHSHGVIHRDIKPHNIMVMRDGSIKVADFGIACLENASQTLTHQALGSVHYISPEQARGDRIDARSDIYSAGVVLYEMLTGHLPFEGESVVSVAIQRLSSIPLAPRSINPYIPEQLELICMKAMSSDIEKRYPSADKMIQDLEAFRKNPNVRLDFQLEDIYPVIQADENSSSPEEATKIFSPPPEPENKKKEKELNTMKRTEPSHSSTPPNSTRFSINQILFGVVGVLAVILAIVLFHSILNSFQTETPDRFVVKSVIGYTIDAAKELDGVKGIFEIKEAGEISSTEYPPGTIARQDPAADDYRKGKNLVIRVWVSSGEETGTMLDVTNQTLSQAEKVTLKTLITQYDLTVTAAEEDMQYHDVYPAGHIISSIPAAGETIKKGDTIRFILSKGRQSWNITNFVGMNIDQVTKQLAGLRLIQGAIEFAPSDKPVGTILSQQPEALTQVMDGATVSFVVSKGLDSSPVLGEPVEEPETEENNEEQQEQPAQQQDSQQEQQEEQQQSQEQETSTEEPQKLFSTTVSIPLPTNKESGNMEVYQDGKRIFSDTVDCTTGKYDLTVFGNGSSFIVVYLDRDEIYSKIITINENTEEITTGEE